MSEIGGYLAFPTHKGKMLYGKKILLNSCRSCLEYLIREKKIQRIYIPFYICEVIEDVCRENGVNINHYHLNKDLYPDISDIPQGAYLLIVNYYGILSTKYINGLSRYYQVIIDNTQSYFSKPLKNVYTIYSCRKYFGVPDGGILAGCKNMETYHSLGTSYSYDKVMHLIGRYERTANEFYPIYLMNEKKLGEEGLLKMSLFTKNLLSSIDYRHVKNKRRKNFSTYKKELGSINELKINFKNATFAYPFHHKNAEKIKKKLLEKEIYIPTLWTNCLKLDEGSLEYRLAKYTLPLPCSQDVKKDDIYKIIKIVKESILWRKLLYLEQQETLALM